MTSEYFFYLYFRGALNAATISNKKKPKHGIYFMYLDQEVDALCLLGDINKGEVWLHCSKLL